MADDITLPEVPSFAQAPRFYRDGNKDMVEISFIGAKDTVVKKVTPEVMQRFRAEWDAYCDGRPMEKRKGTPLTDLPEITEQAAESLISRNLHTLEELAVLNDAQCQGLGHGMIALRKKAQALVMQRQFAHKEETRKIVSELSKTAQTPAPDEEVAALKEAVAEQGRKIDQLVDVLTQLVQTKKPRPRKDANGPKLSS